MSSLRRWFYNLFRFSSATSAQSFSELSSRIDLNRFESVLHHRMRNRDLFLQAVLHRSYLQFSGMSHVQSNERLEFLGDSILNMLVGEKLYKMFPDAEEGQLTILRARLVNRKALAQYAKQIHLRDFMLLSNSASHAAEKGADTILADAYEAVVGALFIDGGLDEARRFVERQLVDIFKDGTLRESDDNYKSALLEYAQANGKILPRYTIVKEEGPDHERTFTIEVSIGEGMAGVGTGKNKKEAEQAAAENALTQILKRPPASGNDAGENS